jgi:hypothetical protein
MNLSPAETEAVKRAAAAEIADRFFAGIDIDELNTMELSTCASFLGIPVDRAAKLLPYVEVGPRSRRVTLADYKAYLAENTRNQAAKRNLPKSA